MSEEAATIVLMGRIENLEKTVDGLSAKIDGLADLIALNHAVRTGGRIINWVSKIVASIVMIAALYKYGLGAMMSAVLQGGGPK